MGLIILQLFLSFLFWATAGSVHGQVRFEQEKRMKLHQVPDMAVHILRPCSVLDRVRWYQEFSELGRTCEAKFRSRRFRYSVEFDSSGSLLDVERLIKLKEMTDRAQQSLQATLEDSFSRFRIEKIQAQYLLSDRDLCSLFSAGEYGDAPDFYEIVVSGLKKGRLSSYEYLFDLQGVLHKRSEILSRPYENLEQ